MPSAMDERPFLVFQKTRGNRFTLPVLLGAIEKEDFSKNFRILLAESPVEVGHRPGENGGVVGFSFMTPDLGHVREELKEWRKALPKNTIFIAGGSHATGDPMGTLQIGFDYVFSGEAEQTFPAFLRQFLEGRKPSARIIREEGKSGPFLTHPPHSLEKRFFAPIEITRGCLYNCTFCQTPRIFGRVLRHRPPENLAMHLLQALPYGYRQTKFISPNAFSYGAQDSKVPSRPALEELFLVCQKAGIEGVHFGCFPSEVRPDWVNPEVLDLVKRYCRNKTIVLGAQSGSDPLLERLKRGHTAEQALAAVRWIHQAGFLPHVDFVFGFPEETMEDRRITLRLMERMIEEFGAKIHAHTYLPLPGTPLFQKNPSPLEAETKNSLEGWERKKRLDGWWKEQEVMSWKIVKWRDEGWIKEGTEIAECGLRNEEGIAEWGIIKKKNSS